MHVKTIVFLTLLSALFGWGCTSHEPSAPEESNLIDVKKINAANDSMVKDAKQMIHTGDLLLRKGNDFSSEQVRDMSKEDKTYSHAGIALVENGSIYVYHVEPDFYYVKDKVRKEIVDSFFNRAHNTQFAVARFQLDSNQINTLIDFLDKKLQEKVAFDMAFDLKTDDKMYCSEMIKKGLAKATQNKIVIEVQHLTDKSKFKIIKQYFKVPEKRFVNMEIIPIDRLYLNKSCTILKRYTYQQ